MSGAIYMAAAGALNHQLKIEVLANNIANADTTGFKEDRLSFRVLDAVESGNSNPTGDPDSTESQELLPVPSATRPDFTSGGMKFTGNTLDLALEGDGFFCVQTPDGERYTRNGSFSLNPDGVLVTEDGLPVLGTGGEITISDIDDKKFTVDDTGKITAGEKSLGSLMIVDFQRSYALKKVGNSMFAPDDASATEIEAKRAVVHQGFIELSNVNVIRAMTDMIEAFRGYESYQKVIHSIDEVLGKTINEVGKL